MFFIFMARFIEEYRLRVLEEITSIEEEIPRVKEETRPVAPDNAIGRLTRMEAIGAKAIAEAQLRTLKNRLRRLEAQLEKVENRDPELGRCLECGEDIPKARLLARPESIRCVECLNDKS